MWWFVIRGLLRLCLPRDLCGVHSGCLYFPRWGTFLRGCAWRFRRYRACIGLWRLRRRCLGYGFHRPLYGRTGGRRRSSGGWRWRRRFLLRSRPCNRAPATRTRKGALRYFFSAKLTLHGFSTPESPSEDYINMARTECRARRRCHCGTQKYSDCSTAIGRLE